MALTSDIVLEKIQGWLGQGFKGHEETYGMLCVQIAADDNIRLLELLYNDPITNMQFLTDLTGAHYPDRKGEEFEVIYHLHSLVNNYRLRIKCRLGLEDLHIKSATTLYSAANFMERETFDFFGIIFTGHPNLVRILNVDEMDYYPMRKEYPLEDQTRTDKEDEYFGR